MKYLDEFRNREAALALSVKIRDTVRKPINIMEICGGQTHTILKYNLESFLPEEVTLIHGPGCPVCVSPVEMIDRAIALASIKDVIFTSFGDMLRVPGSESDLLRAKAEGADVRMVYSPLDALKIARENPKKKIIFFAIGFETTAPANARTLLLAKAQNITNFFLLSSQMLVPPAIEAIFNNKAVRINALLAAGHVCTVTGLREYEQLAEKYKIPVVATGFEPLDILQGIYLSVKQSEEKRCEVENQYSRVVTREGNTHAQGMISKVFEIEERHWRGIGMIPRSGLKVKDEFSDFNALLRFDLNCITSNFDSECIAGEILQGIKKPDACPVFGKSCKPEHPLGAPMVSSEGACAAYFLYKKSDWKND